MADYDSFGQVVSRTMRFAMVPDGLEPIDWLDGPLSLDRQSLLPPQCNIVRDQADGARGPEQALCSKPQSCALCQAIIKIGGVSPRGGTETGR